MDGARAWSFLTVEDNREYGGNTGYDDAPLEIYRYDSYVPNHLQVRTGDLVAIRTKKAVLGVSRIEEILKGSASKERLRCPICRDTNIKIRKGASPPWRCKTKHHEFDTPLKEQVAVETFEAKYGARYHPLNGELSLEKLQAAVIRPSDQMSIVCRQNNWDS